MTGLASLLSAGSADALERALAAPGFVLDRSGASTVRDHAAGVLFSDPSRAYRLSRILLRGMRHSAEVPDAGTRAVVWRCRAEACFYTGRMREAKAAYETAVAEAEAARDAGLLGQILVGRIALLALMGESAASARLFPRAERLLRRAGDLTYLAKLHMNRGNAFYHQERYQEAYDAYGRSAGFLAAAGSRGDTWTGLLINQAIACAHLSKVGEARKLLLTSEASCRHLALAHLEAQAKFNRAQVERIRGDYRQALALLEEAGGSFESKGVRDLAAAAVLGRAEIYLELGMGPEAEELAHAAGDTFAREQMAFDAVVSAIAEAQALRLQDRPEEARKLLEEADRFYARRRIRPRRAVVLLHLARALLALDRPAEARAAASRALRTFTVRGMLQQASAARRALAEIDLFQGRADRAEAVLRSAIRRAAGVSTGEKLELHALAGRVSVLRGRPREAARRLRRAIGFLEAQRRLIPGIELRSRAFETQVAVYHDLIHLLLEEDAPRVESVFSLLQASRARGFRERLSRRPAGRAGITEEKRARLGSLVQRLEEQEQSPRPDPTRMNDLRRQANALEVEIERELQRAQGLERGARRWSGAGGPHAVMGRLRPHETVIEFFVSGPETWALVLRSGASALRRLGCPPEAILAEIESLRLQLETMALTADRPAGNPEFLRMRSEVSLGRLYTRLVKPLEDLLPGSGRLILIPHGFMHQVPFESLHDGATYIDARWTVSRCPAADLVAKRRARRRGARGRRVVVAGVIEGGPEFINSELEAVASAFPRDEVSLLRDPTASDLKRALAGADILHLSTHAVFRDDNPAFSRLRMKDGALFLADIAELRVSTDLVVLSACNTGQVFAGRGDDLAGVAHGFLAAGTRQLVASRWRVHDESTRAMMERFYRHLEGQEDWDPAAALRSAAREVRQRWPHPFYWAGFSLHG